MVTYSTSLSNFVSHSFSRQYVDCFLFGVCCSLCISTYLIRIIRKPTMWFPNRSDTNRPDTNRSAQSQQKARIWNIWVQKVEEFYDPSSENKGDDQVRSYCYCEADLRLSFRVCRLFVFPSNGSFIVLVILYCKFRFPFYFVSCELV